MALNRLMKIRRAYYYLFYRLYKLSESAPSKWWSDWKAALAIVALEVWLFLSLGVYYAVYTKTAMNLEFSQPIVFIPLIIILLLNYSMFIHSSKWKLYVKEFELLPKARNKVYGRIVFILIACVIINLVFSFYLMSRVDWSKYQ